MIKSITTLFALALMATPSLAMYRFSTPDIDALTGFSKGSTYSRTMDTHKQPGTGFGLNNPAIFYQDFADYGHAKVFGGKRGFWSEALDIYESEYIHTTRDATLQGIKDYGGFTLNVHNDDDDWWGYQLRVDYDDQTSDFGDYVELEGRFVYDSRLLELILPDSEKEIIAAGLVITNIVSDSDVYHTSINVPAPGALILGTLGMCGVSFLRRRHKL